MRETRIDSILIIGSILAWIGIFMAASRGVIPVSGKITDAALIMLAAVIMHRGWRIWRRSKAHV
ncbi:MAG: hypothetical protein U1E93_09100 [Alphaproteobacteria bacterium]